MPPAAKACREPAQIAARCILGRPYGFHLPRSALLRHERLGVPRSAQACSQNHFGSTLRSAPYGFHLPRCHGPTTSLGLPWSGLSAQGREDQKGSSPPQFGRGGSFWRSRGRSQGRLGGVWGGVVSHWSPEAVLGASRCNNPRQGLAGRDQKGTPNGTQNGTQHDRNLKTKFDIKHISL